MSHPRYDKLARRGREFLGVEHPIMCGAMTWISDSALVAAVAENGGFGLLAAGNLPPDELEREIARARDLTDKPFGVNLITVAPNYREHLEIACRMECPFVVFAAVYPDAAAIKQAKDSGVKTLCFAPTESVAQRMLKFGIDGLILEGYEAGGHIGPISSLVLMQEVLLKVRDDIPVFLAGGIATGQIIAHLLLMGAAGVQLGTRFVMCEECNAHPRFKEAFRKARARDAVGTPAFDSRLPVIPVRALKNAGTEAFKELQLDLIRKMDETSIERTEVVHEVEGFWVGALRRAAREGDVEHGSLMAGQSVGLMDKVMPMREIFAELLDDAEVELGRIAGLLGR